MAGLTPGGPTSEADRLILSAAIGGHELTLDEFQRVLEHVQQAGFDPNARERARGRLAGLTWRGRTLRGSDLLSAAEKHYVWHVLANGEWPAGTSLNDYVASISRIVVDSTTGVFTNRYQGEWSLGLVRESRELRGPRGGEWVLVQYRVSRGHWLTAFQPAKGLDELSEDGWSDVRWLRDPTLSESR